MPDPFILMCAPNGARRNKADHARIPITPVELAQCARDVLQAGASILHLHVRDEGGGHTLGPEYYRPAIEAIKAEIGENLIIQITTEAVGIYSREEQIACVKELRPEAASIALREICPTEQEETDTESFFSWIRRESVFPQIILYDQTDVVRFLDMKERGVFAVDNPFVLCVLGRYGASGEPPEEALDHFSRTLAAEGVPWAICGFGAAENQLAAESARRGGHVRVGFENNLWRADGEFAADNSELVRAAGEAAKECGRSLTTADDIRNMFDVRR